MDRDSSGIKNIQEMMVHISGRDNYDDFRDIDRKIAERLNDPKIDIDSGKEYFVDPITNDKIFFPDNATEHDKKRMLKDNFEEEEKLAGALTDEFIKFFNGGQEEWKGYSANKAVAQEQAEKLLSGVNKETHTIQKLENIHGFDGASKDIVIVKHKETGAAKIISVNRRDWVRMRIDNEESMRDEIGVGKFKKKFGESNNIFGNKINNNALKLKYGIEGLEATDENYKLLRSGLIAMELKSLNEIQSVDGIMNGSVTGFTGHNTGTTDPGTTNMNALLSHIAVLKDVTKDIQSDGMKTLFNDKVAMDPKTYNEDYVSRLRKFILAGRASDKIHKRSKEELIKELAEPKSNGLYRNKNLIKELLFARRTLGDSLKTNDTRNASEDYRLLSLAIVQLHDIDYKWGEMTKNLSLNVNVTSQTRIANDGIQYLSAEIDATEYAINAAYKKFERKLKKKTRDLMAEVGHGTVTQIVDKEGSKIFAHLWKVDPMTDDYTKERKTNIADLYMLKDEDDASLQGMPASKAFIKFFNQYVVDGFQLSLTPKQFAEVEAGKSLEKGMIPLINASVGSDVKQQDLDWKGRLAATIKSNHNKYSKNTQDTFNALNARLDNPYLKQLETGNVKKTRLGMMGMDVNGEDITGEGRQHKNYETNLEQVIAKFMQDNLRVAAYESTLGVYDALNTVAYIDQTDFFNDTEDIRKIMGGHIKQLVFNEHNKQSKPMKLIDTTQRGLTMTALGFSPKQIILETATNMFGSANAVLTQAMRGKMKRFTIVDWTKAGAQAIGDYTKGYTTKDVYLTEALVQSWGLYKADSEAQARAEELESKKNGAFQSKWAYHLNNVPYKIVKAQAVMAQMHREGVMKAMTVNEEGELVYKYWEDARLQGIWKIEDGKHIFDESSLRSESGDVKKAALLFQALQADLANESLLDENHMPMQPYSIKELREMKDYAMGLFGSMDKDGKTYVQKSTIGRMFLKFKSWAVVKKDNYWNPEHDSKNKFRRYWVKEKTIDGEVIEGRWENDTTAEGILQTIHHLMRGCQEVLSEDGKGGRNLVLTFQEMSPKQKENMAKLLADILMTVVLVAALTQLFDDEMFKSGFGEVFATSVNNATADLNVVQSMTAMTDSNPLAVIAFAQRALVAAYDSIAFSASGEFQDAGSVMARQTGLGKSLIW